MIVLTRPMKRSAQRMATVTSVPPRIEYWRTSVTQLAGDRFAM
jgi:hypothetical protein